LGRKITIPATKVQDAAAKPQPQVLPQGFKLGGGIMPHHGMVGAPPVLKVFSFPIIFLEQDEPFL
jgi:hypothetical protein